MNLRHLLLTSLILFQAIAFANDEIRFEIEKEIESLIRNQIGNIVKKGNIFIQVEVTEKIKTPEVAASKKLPYSQLNIDSSRLQRLAFSDKKELLFTTAVKITLTIDDRVTDGVIAVVKDKLEKNFNLDGKKRTLEIKKADFALITKQTDQPAPDEATQIKAEKASLEAEKTRLEMEREKLQNLKLIEEKDKEKGELNKKIEEAEKKIKELQDKIDNPEKKDPVELIKEFQITIFAAIIAFSMFIWAILSFVGKGRGPANITTAIQSVAEGLNAIASSNAPPETSEAELEELSDAQAGVEGEDDLDVLDKDKIAESLKLIEEKIKVLSDEGNFSFYANLIEMMESNLEYASALIVALPNEMASQLLSKIPAVYMDKIREYLSSPGALMKAKRKRATALQEFYGRIALDEYVDSPLLKVKHIEWFLKLDNKAIIALISKIEKEDRSRLLACLSPSRVSLMLNSETDAATIEMLLEALADVKKIGFGDIDGLFEKIQKIAADIEEKSEGNWRAMVDAPKYIADILNNSDSVNASKILESIAQDVDLVKELRHYYIPISDLAVVPEAVVKDIFSSRSASDIAIIIYDMSDEIKKRIVAQIPSVLADTVNEEIETILADDQGLVTTQKKSAKAKKAIEKTLIKLYRDGILKYPDQDGGGSLSSVA